MSPEIATFFTFLRGLHFYDYYILLYLYNYTKLHYLNLIIVTWNTFLIWTIMAVKQ